MLNKIIAGLMNWLVASIVVPAMTWIWDMWSIKKQYKELKERVKDLKDAKTKSDIDTSIDRLP